MKKSILTIIVSLLIITSCQDKIADYTVTGENIKKFTLTVPENNSEITLNPAIPDYTLEFSWEAAEAGLGSKTTYTLLFDAQGGDFTEPMLSVASDSNGTETTATLSYDDLVEIISLLGETSTLSWTVEAQTNHPDNDQATTRKAEMAFALSLMNSTEGINEFNLISPIQSSYLILDGLKPDSVVSFAWTSTTSSSGAAVTYKVLFTGVNETFNNPILTVDSDSIGGVPGADTTLTKTNAEWKEFFVENAIGVGAYKWTVQATAGEFNWMADPYFLYFQHVGFEFPMYIYGDATSAGWTNTSAIQLTELSTHEWIGYVLLTGGEFLFTTENSDDGTVLGSGTGDELIQDGANIASPNTLGEARNYRVWVQQDEATTVYTYYVIPAEMILVGSGTPAGWTIEDGYHMYYNGDGKWITYSPFVSGAFKFFAEEGNWEIGYKDPDPNDAVLELSLEPGPPDINSPGDGWFKSTINTYEMTYELEAATQEMFAVGSATPNGWDIDNPTPLTYTDTGFVATMAMTGGAYIKFVPISGSWDLAFGMTNGELSSEAGSGTDIPGPETDGTYTVVFDMDNKEVSFIPAK